MGTDSDSSEDEKPSGKASAKNKKTSFIAKKKVDKVKAAKAKLKQMQKSGFWGAPPRRAASLNASAMVHIMYDNEHQQQPSKANIKTPPKLEDNKKAENKKVENKKAKKK